MKISLYYLHKKGEPEIIRYIGQTIRTLSTRLIQHRSSAKQAKLGKRKMSYLYYWIVKCEYQIEIALIEEVNTRELANTKEVELIEYYKKQGLKLVNTTTGGEGGAGLFYTKNARATKVIQYTMDGNFVKVHSCIKKAAEEVGTTPGLISGCIRMDRVKSAGGYIWILYKKEYLKKIDSYSDRVQAGKDSTKAKLSKKIYQYSLNGNYIREWESLHNIERESGFFRYNIGLAIKRKTHAYNYLWDTKKMDNVLPYIEKKKKTLQKKERPLLHQFTKNGVFVQTWDKVKNAANSFSIGSTAISVAIKRKSYSKGYIWTYKNSIDPNDYKIKVNKNRYVYQYSLDGKFIKHWDTLVSVEKEIHISSSDIINCITGKTKRAGDYQWFRDFKGDAIASYVKPVKKRVSRPVEQIDKHDNFIKVWKGGVQEIIKNTDWKEQNIRLAIAGKTIQTAYGFKWKYL